MRICRTLILVSYGASIITVKVGLAEGSKTFTVHKTLLVKHSDFFNTALNGHLAESKTHSIPLPEHDPESFNIFVQFLCSGHVYTATDEEDDRIVREQRASIDKEWERLQRARR